PIIAHRLALRSGKKGFGNAREVRSKLSDALSSAMSRGGSANILMSDVIPPFDRNHPKIKEVLDEINKKTGWRSIKQSIEELLRMVEQHSEREQRGEKANPIFLHRLFLGNPGTGKTTCAELYGRLLKQLGLLSIGEVVKKTASHFVGQYIGQSQTKTNDI